MKERCEFANALCHAPHLELVVCKMVNVVHFPVVRAEECRYMTPLGLDGFRVDSSTLINKANAVIDGEVRVTLRIKIQVRYPAITT